MKIKKITHHNVLPNGQFSDRSGEVVTRGALILSEPTDNQHWLSVIHPRNPDATVEVMVVEFESREEMESMLGGFLSLSKRQDAEERIEKLEEQVMTLTSAINDLHPNQ